VPPRYYGGTERVVAYLTEALVALGHQVTLFSSADAVTTARLVPVRDMAIRLDPARYKSDVAAHLLMLDQVARRFDEFDLVHFHIDLLQFPLFEQRAHHTLTTLHGRLDLKDLPAAFRRWQQFPLVSISDAQREPLSFANWVGTVHHGVPADIFTFAAAHRGYLAFVGRISPEKRPDRAIRVARCAGMTIRIAAKVDDADAAYFHREIEPLLREPGVEFVGEIDDAQKNELLGGAAAVLFPIDWPEPFGLIMIEAMACGTPVVAWDCGSVREVVDEGLTGFIVSSEDEALAALERLPALDRRCVRDVFEQRFTSIAMAQRYLAVYEKLRRSAGDTDTSYHG
jgi:glycosyltransferase involved in cell wall biosynthesis